MEKNKNGKKLLEYIGIGIASIFAGWLAYRSYKKELKKVVEEETQKEAEDGTKNITEVIKTVIVGGTSEQIVEPEPEAELPRTFIKDLYETVKSSDSEFDSRFFDLNYVLESGKKIIHVTEDVMSGNRHLKFLLEVPEYTNNSGNYNKLRIGDIISTCKNAGKYIMAKILKDPRDPAWSKMVVVMEYSYSCLPLTKEGNIVRKVQFLEIPNWVLRKMYEDTEDRVNKAVRLYEDWSSPEGIKKIQERIGSDIDLLIHKDAERKSSAEGDGIFPGTIRGEEVSLMYSYGFQAEDIMANSEMITVTEAAEILEYLLNDFVIERRGRNGDNPDAILDSHRYNGVLFHAPSMDGRFNSLACFYDTDVKGNVYIDSFCTAEKEEEEKPSSEEKVPEATEKDLEELKKHFNSAK